MLRVAAIVVLAVALMVTLKDGRALRDTGLIASCTTVTAPNGASENWQACRSGRLEGRPNLKRQSCESAGVVADVEYWRCPSPTESAPAG
jgi:hypothetical protein